MLVSSLRSLPLTQIALSTGWIKREPRKIFLLPLIETILQSILGREVSYQTIAIALGLLRSESVSRQAVFKRINFSLVSCLQKCMAHLFHQQNLKNPVITKIFKSFKRVIIQDSTSFQAPDKLVNKYKGNYSPTGIKAVGKVDVLWNIKNGTILEWILKPYAHSDKKAAENVLRFAQKGDLIIRDLGYLVFKVLKELKIRKADFLSRYQYGHTLYDSKTGGKLNLLLALRKNCNQDRWVLLGKEKIPVRMVAIPLSAKATAERQRKARKDRDKRLNHSREYMELLGWKIFITSVDRSVWTAEQMARAYGMRWSIEMLFKSWKSCMNANPPLHHAVSRPFFFETYISLILLFAISVQLPTYINLLLRNSYCNHHTNLSLIKMSVFLSISFRYSSVHEFRHLTLLDLAEYYSKHEKRKRKTLAQNLWTMKN